MPNREREIIWLRENIESQEFIGSKSKLTLAMGKDINGRIVTADLAGMPHLLIAGSTGAGKSVAINAMIMSILYKATPDQVRLILVDPEAAGTGQLRRRSASVHADHHRAEAGRQCAAQRRARNGAPPETAGRERRAQHRSVQQAVRSERHAQPVRAKTRDDKPLPYIVIIIDELADLMMLDAGNVEESITRLAQMARAVGIHLVLATQRPSVDVITGLIKANFPARISFRVATKVDSRTILDANGAEALLGQATCCICRLDRRACIACMLRSSPKKKSPRWSSSGARKARRSISSTSSKRPKESARPELTAAAETRARTARTKTIPCTRRRALVVEFGKASTSLLQRRLRIGYGRAAHLIDLMERDGIVGAADGPKPREVLKRPDWISEIEETTR